jgi:hypothetical protein
LTAGVYIKVAMVLSIAFAAVVFMLVYRLIQLPAEPRTVAVRQAESASVQSDSAADVAATATPAASTSSVIMAEAKQYPNVHVSPGLSSRTIGVFNQGSSAEVLGRSADSVWLEIRYPQPQSTNGVGWVSTDLVSLSAPIASVPVVNSP